MKKLTRQQRKIIYISTVVLCFFLVLWIFIYTPQSCALRLIKNKLSAAETEIAEIMRIAEGRELSKAIIELDKQLIKTTSQLPSGEEGIINYLSEEARKHKIEVGNISLGPRGPSETGIPGYEIQEQSITLNLGGEFRQIGDYLNVLRNQSPILIKVNEINITGRGEGQVELGIVLRISAYLLQQK